MSALVPPPGEDSLCVPRSRIPLPVSGPYLRGEIVKRQVLQPVDNLILEDLEQHPGLPQEQVFNRLMVHYSRTYLHTRITRLISLGHIKETRSGKMKLLYHKSD